jgi:hypothetical protein
MNLKHILIFISIGFLVYLLFESLNQIDFAATKNNFVISEKKMQIDSIQNIESVKIKAKLVIDVIRQDRRDNSTIAIRRFWIIMIFYSYSNYPLEI